MSFQTCPTDIVEASAEQVWGFLGHARRYDLWADAKLLEGPDRPLAAGDRFVMGAGPGHRMKVVFDVREVSPPRQLALEIRLPLGIVNHEVLRITPVGPKRCRVTYN